MNEIESRALEFLAAEYVKEGRMMTAKETMDGNDLQAHAQYIAIRAIAAALSAAPQGVPEGWVLVPVEPTAEMLQAAAFGVSGKTGQKFRPMMTAGYVAMLAAKPGPQS